MYRTEIIEQLVQDGIPAILKAITKIATHYPCEAIQIFMSNISNVYSNCIAGALMFQGDTANVCYNLYCL